MPKLQRFNQALVDHYAPEASHLSLISGISWEGVRTFLHYYKQKKDYYKALRHAETNLLRFFDSDKLRQLLTGKSIESMLKQIHKFAGKTICSDYNVPSGEYIDSIVVRWEKRLEFEVDLRDAMNTPRSGNPGKKIDELFLKHGLQACAHTWKLLGCAVASNNIELPKEFNFGDCVFAQTMGLIALKRKRNELAAFTDDIDKVVKFVFPDEIPGRMSQFADNLAQRIKQCDGQLNNVVNLAAHAFRDFTRIHPFPNANGRVSTVLLNMILLGFGYPSIVLRNHQDKHDEQSEYNQVMNIIDQRISPFVEYVKNKVVQAQKSPDVGNEESRPAIDGSDDIMLDQLFSIAKDCKRKLKDEEGKKFNDQQNDFLQKPTLHLNQYLKEISMSSMQKFGVNTFYLPGMLEYTETEKRLAPHIFKT